MIEINLLPEDLRKSARARGGGGGANRLWVLVAVLLVVAAAGVAYFHMVPLGRRQAKHRYLAGRLAKLKKQSKELSQLQAAVKHIEKRKRALADLYKKRVLWSEKLDQFTDIVPRNVWIRSMKLSAPRRSRRSSGSGGSLVLECYSAGAEEKGITLFRDRLKENTDFWQDVARMNRISHRRREFPEYVEGVALEFTVDLTLKAPDAKKSAKAKRPTRTARSR